jgi:dihydrofolate synthase / folylpolyglutamate synthase
MEIHGFLKSLNPGKIKLGHERTIALMAECENPQKGLKVIQIAGTNGKGSVCAILEKIYRVAGYKTGLFTSPHLNKLNERIRMNGLAIEDKEIYLFLRKYGRGVIRTDASFFETLTAIAFWFFKKNQVDIAIMETGLGGRLDSVTICEPVATGITKISLDHIEILGDTLEKIAFEKAGIMKKNISCYTINQNKAVLNVLKDSARKIKCPLETIKPLSNSSIALHGSHQNENAGLALAIIKELDQFNIKEKHISDAIKSINWFGRYQILSEAPKIIFDVGHNTDGISAFLKTFSKENILGQKHLLIALQERKDISAISNQLTQQFDTILCAEIKIKNFMNAKDLHYNLGEKSNLKIINQLTVSFLDHFINQLKPEDCLCIVGTHYWGELISKKFKISFDRL